MSFLNHTRSDDTPLSDLLNLVRVRSEVALRCAPQLPFALSFPATFSSMHAVMRGSLTVRVEGLNEPVQLYPGEFLLLPHGTPHVIKAGGACQVLEATEALLQSNFDSESRALDSDGSAAWFWAGFTLDHVIARRLLDALPLAIVLRDLNEGSIDWFHQWRIMVDESKRRLPGAGVMVSRLLDVVFVKAVRRWIEGKAESSHQLTAAVDPRIAKAISAFHASPARPWQVADLAQIAGMSRSSFAFHFELLFQQPPGSYLAAWRLDKAAERLRNTVQSIKQIAEAVGYESDAAFSRAFRDRFDFSPSQWRKQG